MSRHVADHRAQSDGGRLKHFYRIEKTANADGPDQASRMLHKRPLSREVAGRTGHFLRIERGNTA